MNKFKSINEVRCKENSVEEWAAWYEGEEGWGGDDDNETCYEYKILNVETNEEKDCNNNKTNK